MCNILRPLGVVLVSVCLIAPALGQSTWNGGGGDGLWSNANNWGGTAPTSGVTTSLIFAGTSQLNTTQNIADPFILNNLTFNSGAGAFTIGGTQELRFGGASNTLTQSSANNISISAPVSFDGDGSITGTGAGTLTLNNLTVRQGTLTLSRNLTVGTLTMGLDTASTAATLSTGSNVLTLGGDFNFVSATIFTNSSPPATLNGTINLTAGNHTFSGAAISNSPANPFIDVFINATLTGAGGFVKGGTTGSDARPYILLNAANTYSGPTILQSGSQFMYLGVDKALPDGTALTVSGGGAVAAQLVFLPDQDFANVGRGTSQSVGSLSDGGDPAAGFIDLGSDTGSTSIFTIGSNNTDTSFSGTIRRGGQIVKVGNGTLTLTGNNLYTGNTTINAGTLLVNGQINSNSGTGTGAVIVNAAGTLGGTGQALGAIILHGRIQGGDGVTATAAGLPKLTTGAVTFTSGSTLRVAVGGASQAAVVNSLVSAGTSAFNASTGTDVMTIHLFSDGSLNMTGSVNYTIQVATYGSTNATSANYSFIADNFSFSGTPIITSSPTSLSISFTPVPEPVTIFGLAAAGMGLVGFVRRRVLRQA